MFCWEDETKEQQKGGRLLSSWSETNVAEGARSPHEMTRAFGKRRRVQLAVNMHAPFIVREDQ
jgi:hypothetical protein